MHFEADPKNLNLNPYFSSIHIDQNFLLQRREKYFQTIDFGSILN